MKRILDIAVAGIGLIFASPLMLIIALAVKLTSPGPVLHWSKRIGKHNRIFLMPKVRTMRTDTPQTATHLLKNSHCYITPVGKFLRKASLDELPQLWSILVGDMSLVGPRPALFNQDDLIRLRSKQGVHQLTPGITGWAQINGRDGLDVPNKVELDAYYLEHQSIAFDLRILWQTVFKVLRQEGIKQADEATSDSNRSRRAA